MTPAEQIPVVILCGGQGTRLREETEYRPKPMVEIGPHPILWHIMKIYRQHGHRHFILCLGYKGWEIKQYFLRYNEMHRDFTVTLDRSDPVQYHNTVGDEDWKVTLVETGLHSGTGARLARVRGYIESDTFCFTYGDAVGNVDIGAQLAFHRAQGRLATVTGVRPTSRYGEMRTEDGAVLEFREKPAAEGVVSGGFFVLERGVFDYLDADPQLFFEREPLRRLARDGQLSVYMHEQFWHPMDTYRDYLHLNEIWSGGEVPWKTW
ncbi:MAG: glucose-1-phosphate cytidylyltransferase [Acidobacteria bacterium]|mgnify:FL=1|nr:MAG: glucose-1-phosphate cytidylyltransferase [Acidobacteriota bacterium]REJ99498.1 MAG: glucose-1-phosphate cytidylyltransferase [Acidobacteriota bacterium]